jgi:tRNA1Val (adenine37-N6)-methyltransferase
MPTPYFQFKKFIVWHHKCAMKVGTDGVLLGSWVKGENSDTILDVGTGTGLIALMLAQKLRSVIDAVEIDPEACTQARENIHLSPWSKQIRVYQSSFQDYCNTTDKKYDLIVSNPPYFNNSLKAPDNKRSIARHSDTLPYDVLLRGVSQLLTDNGRFCVILPYLEAQLFIVDAALSHLYCSLKTNIKPAVDKKTNRVLLQFSKIRTKMDENVISILDLNKEYTAEYKELTREYYLNF